MNQTKIKGGCQSERNVVPHDSKSDLPLGDYMERSKTDETLVQMPEYIDGKEQFVVQNVTKVLHFHKTTILPEIEKAKTSPEEILNLFSQRKEQFKAIYGKFCSIRNRYSQILQEFKKYFSVRTHSITTWTRY